MLLIVIELMLLIEHRARTFDSFTDVSMERTTKLLVTDFAYQHEDDVAVLGSRHRRGAGFTLSGHTKNIMRHEP